MTKRSLISDVAKTFDALGWFSPTIVKAKILLQMLWLEKVRWDDLVPDPILEEWSKWRSELPLLSMHHTPRCYYPKTSQISCIQLHGFSDASERAHSGVVYLRMEDTDDNIHTSLMISVAPIKPLRIPRVELNGALILSQLLHQCKEVLGIPLISVHAWTDSTIVLAWLQGNPRRLKVYVANRVAQIVDLIPACHWKHVVSKENIADCASRRLYPTELLCHDLWWNGPDWMKTSWPKSNADSPDIEQDYPSEMSTTAIGLVKEPLIPIDKLSSFNLYKRTTAWVVRFLYNCKAKVRGSQLSYGPLSTQGLGKAATYWYSIKKLVFKVN